jgi:hypothetical protein
METSGKQRLGRSTLLATNQRMPWRRTFLHGSKLTVRLAPRRLSSHRPNYREQAVLEAYLQDHHLALLPSFHDAWQEYKKAIYRGSFP